MKPRHTLAIDIETYSETDLKKCGVYKYVADPSFDILIVSYGYDDGPVQLLDLSDPAAVESFGQVLKDPSYLKTAFNASFERTCFSAFYATDFPADQWECTLAKAYTCGLFGGLDQVASVLHIPGKLKEGFALLKYFCTPCKPTKVNGMRTRNLPAHEPEKWQKFQDYCMQDVRVECQIRKKLSGFQAGPLEKRLWVLDQKINDYGVRIDRDFVTNVIDINRQYADFIGARITELTGIKNPKAVEQLKDWLTLEIDEEIESLAKDKLPAVLKKCKSEAARELIALRQRMSKTSIKKYDRMLQAASDSDDRLRGLLQYYGASRTGRWSGRLIQPHNLPKNDKAILSNIPLARGLVLDGDAHYLDICYDNLPVILSQLVRTAFVPTPGRRFIVSDLSAIEARIVAWLARETWRLDVFKTHGKIYEASASRMFNVPLEQITKDSPLRYKGKLSELSLGFQGSIGALIRMGALEMGLKESELQGIVNRWRAANPNIVNLWGGLNEAAVAAVENPGVSYTAQDGLIMWADRRPDLTIDTSVCPPVSFQVLTNVLFITLPSGRKLCYLRPRMRPGNYGMTLTYEGVESSSTGSKKWGRVETYGGKLLENIAQGIARDVLAEGMLAIDDAGYDIALHVHDEAVADVPHGTGSVQEINELMSRPVAWAPGLPLAAESFETDFYKKDA